MTYKTHIKIVNALKPIWEDEIAQFEEEFSRITLEMKHPERTMINSHRIDYLLKVGGSAFRCRMVDEPNGMIILQRIRKVTY